MLARAIKIMEIYLCFENQPDEICSHLTEKASKDRFSGPKQNFTNKGKGKGEKERAKKGKKRGKREKSNGSALS